MSLKGIGGLLFFFGIGSIVLSLFDMEFKILMWIDTWGPDIGWAIRGAMAVAGGALWLVGNSRERAQGEPAAG